MPEIDVEGMRYWLPKVPTECPFCKSNDLRRHVLSKSESDAYGWYICADCNHFVGKIIDPSDYCKYLARYAAAQSVNDVVNAASGLGSHLRRTCVMGLRTRFFIPRGDKKIMEESLKGLFPSRIFL